MSTAPYLVLAVGGTGESWPGDTRTNVSGMLSHITRELNPDEFDTQWVGYDSTYGPLPYPHGVSYAVSVHRGITRLIELIKDDTRPVILIGYSQGAAVISAFLDMLARGHFPELLPRVLCASLVANPNRKPGTGPLPGMTVAGHGITYDVDAPTPARIVPVSEIASPHDAICSAAPDSMLRALATITEFMSFTDLHAWGTDLYNEAKGIDWKAEATSWLDWPRQWTRAQNAIAEALGYLMGRHTSYNVETVPGLPCTYTQLAAGFIESEVEFYEDAVAHDIEDDGPDLDAPLAA